MVRYRFRIILVVFIAIILPISMLAQAQVPSVGFGVGARYNFDVTRAQSATGLNGTETLKIDNASSFYADNKDLVVSEITEQEHNSTVTATVWTGNTQEASEFATTQWIAYLNNSIEYKSRLKTQVEEQGIPIPNSGDFSDSSSQTETNLNGPNPVRDQVALLPLLTSNDILWVQEIEGQLSTLAGNTQRYDLDLSSYTTTTNFAIFTSSVDNLQERFEYNYTSVLDFNGQTKDGVQFRYNQIIVALGIINIRQSYLEFFFDCYGWAVELGNASKSYIDITAINGTQTTAGNTSTANSSPLLAYVGGFSLIIFATYCAKQRKDRLSS